MSMKILDVDLFQDGLRRNIAMLDRLESEVEAIRRAVEGLVAMEDELKGPRNAICHYSNNSLFLLRVISKCFNKLKMHYIH